MRAPVQKTRPRRTGKQTAPAENAEPAPGTTPPAAPVGKGRPTRVRNRLIVAVAVVAAAVAGAGAPSVIAASAQLHEAQELVTLAERTQSALALAHALADERDEVTPYIAAGRPKSKAPSEQRGARVDRQVEELRADGGTPAALREDLDAVAALRRSALTGKSTALEAHEAYTEAIGELHALAEELAEQSPPRAGSGAYALAELDTAVQQAAATRGLLLAAFGVPSTTRTVIDPVTGLPVQSVGSTDADTERRDALTAAAQRTRVASDAALAGFRERAAKQARDGYDTTVSGPEVNAAEKYLAALTDEPSLSDEDLATDVKKLDAALSARIDAMRGAESALYERRTTALENLRDDDVTALEIRIAALGAVVLLAVGITTALARSLTRPLSVLRRGSARLAEAEDPAAQEPIAFTGRNDEFAQAVRSVNALHAQAAALAERVTTLEADRKHLVGQRQKMADAREELRAELDEAAARLDVVRKSIGGTFVNLALRTLGLVERQLAVIESLEEREQDPERLATLFKLDHFATVMRRHSENLLVLAGTEHVQHSAGPVPLVDVVRAAVSEIERYERVRIAALPPHAHVAGFAADDLSHLLAELMENATSFSPPDLPVEVSGWLLENGEVMLSVQDEGIGMTAERLQRLNGRLTDFDPEAPYDQEGEDGLGLGLYVVARLAHRHGARVRLREQKQGGVASVVVLPEALLAPSPPAAVAPSAAPPADGSTVSLPGADAEANSNVLHGRAESDADPLVASAERAVRRAEAEAAGTGADTAAADAPAEAAAADLAGGPEPEAPAAGDPAPADAPETPAARDLPDDTTMALLLPAPSPAPDDEPAPAARAPREEDAPEDDAHGSDAVGLAVPERAAREVGVADADGGPARGHDPERPPAATATAPDGSAPAEDGARTRTEAPVPARVPVQAQAPAPETETTTRESTAAASAPESRGSRPDGPYAIGPDAHERTPDEGTEPDDDPVTDKGLPKRTPKISAPAAAPKPRTGSVDAESLRRRLGGFRRGAEAGRRDVEAEIADETAQNRAPDARDGTTEEAMGGPVEEASS